jgi:hypothetical protein
MSMLLKYSVLTMAAAGLLLAQHGGGGGGGHHGGGGGFGGGGFASHSSGGYSGVSSGRSASPSTGYRPRSYSYNYGNYGAVNRGTYGYGYSTGVNRTLGTRYGYGYGGYGYGRRYGYYGLAYYPFFGYGDSWYDPSYYPPYDQYAPYDAYPAYGAPMQDPNVEMMGSNNYPQGPYYMAPPPVASNDALPPADPIVVVLKNGQRVQMQSYGIMNGLLWDFSRPNSKRIPMASIDVAASVKATQEVGGSFPEQFFGVGGN